MPYDHSSIKRLWETGPESSQIASAFLDKTFQVEVDVPPPLLSDWRDYLLDLLQHVLPAHDAEEFHTIYRLFASNRGPEGLPPTPQELKLSKPFGHAPHAPRSRCPARASGLLLTPEAFRKRFGPPYSTAHSPGRRTWASLEKERRQFGIDPDKARQNRSLVRRTRFRRSRGSRRAASETVGSEEHLLEQVLREACRWRRGESSKVTAWSR